VEHYPDLLEKSVILPPSPLIRFCSDQPATVRQQVRNALGVAEGDFVLVYWGYIYPGKGVETLLQAFRILCRRNEDMRLVLVGGDLDLEIPNWSCSEYFQMVRQLPETLGIADRVTRTGHFSWDSDEGSRYLHAGDVCVLPLDYGVTLNNSSLAAATTHGLPVIATELPAGQDEMLEHGRNVYLCRPRDPEMLAEAIQLISDSKDLRERLRIGALGLARDWFRWERTTERLIEVLEAAISCCKAPGREQSKSRVTMNETKPGKERTSSEMRPQDRDDASPRVQEDNPHVSSVVRSVKNTPNNATAPLVSIIVAVYNVEKYLSQCLDSLVNQTLKDIEIIVVNDASADKSFRIISHYKEKHPNLRVVNCESNKGLASARNIGMRAAEGQYIGFVDGDDWADIRMCEVMYRTASSDNSDVLIADANVFYEDSKTFGQFFDQHIRRTLDPRLRTMPFRLSSEPRVLLLEPVAWTKLYKRSFLQMEGIHFEDGMSSYEDICFHFSVLLKATRISLIDDALPFYRQNRPGQISRMTSRKIFEVFAVFRKIQENLAAWNASADIWGLLIKIQLRQFDWLLQDRVQPHHKREFFASVAKHFEMIPEAGFRYFAQVNPEELPKLICMRRRWLRAYEKVVQGRWPLFPPLYVMVHHRLRSLLKWSEIRGVGMLSRRLASPVRSVLIRLMNLGAIEAKIQSLEEKLNRRTSLCEITSNREEPFINIRRIGGETLFFFGPPHSRGFSEAVSRMEEDYYLSQTAVFREGDTVIDVGAHVGVVSIYLAKKYPFMKVYALEPEPINYSYLKRNIELNGVTNVTAINKAVSGDGQKRTLYIDPLESAWATMNPSMEFSRRIIQTVEADTVSLEQLFEQYGIRHCRLMKITAPGAVSESLKGLTRSRCVDYLCGEVDLQDCSRVKLEAESWRIARQHFWRTIDRRANGTMRSWIHGRPEEP